MGIATSKVCKQLPEKDLQEGSIPSTPIVTPRVIKQELADPRSPSTHISRTPLQLLSSVDLNELNDEITNVDETPAKNRIVLLGIDPRSPTAEFKRTPIIINISESDGPEKICNKNLERVKRSVIISTPKSSCKKVSENIMATVPPKLLESSPIRAKVDINKRKSFIGLLETNMDFTETDLDAVIRAKSKVEQYEDEGNEVASKQTFHEIQEENIDPRSPTTDFLRTPIQNIKRMSDLNDKTNSECVSKCIEQENQSEIDIELEDHNIIEKCIQEICEKVHLATRLEICENQPLKSDTEQSIMTGNTSQIARASHSNALDLPFRVKSAPITPKTRNCHLEEDSREETKSAPVSPPKLNVAADVKEFDKKLTNLIYHDEDVVICPRKVKLKDYDTRSPLRSINSEPVRKTHKLKDDRMKSEYTVSKIPVFKEKNKTEVQCENTPPRNMERRKVKVRKSHWDNADTTLII